MSRKTFVAGVGMIPFTKPGASEPYDVMGAERRASALADAGIDYAECSRPMSAMSTATPPGPVGALPGRPDRHPDRQRQQQLLHRLDGAVPGAAGRGKRRGRLRAGRSASSRCSRARSASIFNDRPSASTRADAATTNCVDEHRSAAARCASSAAPAASTWRSTARSSRRSPRSARRRASTPPTIRSRCSASRDGRGGAGVADDLAGVMTR